MVMDSHPQFKDLLCAFSEDEESCAYENFLSWVSHLSLLGYIYALMTDIRCQENWPMLVEMTQQHWRSKSSHFCLQIRIHHYLRRKTRTFGDFITGGQCGHSALLFTWPNLTMNLCKSLHLLSAVLHHKSIHTFLPSFLFPPDVRYDPRRPDKDLFRSQVIIKVSKWTIHCIICWL